MDAQAQIQAVQDLLAKARAGADGVSDAGQRGEAEKAIDMMARAVSSWAGDLYSRMQAGTYSADSWTTYGQTLSDELASFVKQYQSIWERFSNFFITTGESAEAVENFITQKVDDVSAQVDSLYAQLLGFQQNAGAIADAQQQLAPVQSGLSSEAQDLIFGAGYTAAMATLSTLEVLVSGLQEAIGAIRQGTLHPVINHGRTDIVITQEAAQSAGIAPQIGILPAAVIGIGLISALGTAVALATTLQAYFAHANAIIAANGQHELNQMRVNGQLSEAGYEAATKAGADAKPKPPPGIGDTLKEIEELAIGGLKIAVGGAVAYYGWTNREAIINFFKSLFGGRKPNPRRRRRRTTGARA